MRFWSFFQKKPDFIIWLHDLIWIKMHKYICIGVINIVQCHSYQCFLGMWQRVILEIEQCRWIKGCWRDYILLDTRYQEVTWLFWKLQSSCVAVRKKSVFWKYEWCKGFINVSFRCGIALVCWRWEHLRRSCQKTAAKSITYSVDSMLNSLSIALEQ